jgi:hypothetical protein
MKQREEKERKEGRTEDKKGNVRTGRRKERPRELWNGIKRRGGKERRKEY